MKITVSCWIGMMLLVSGVAATAFADPFAAVVKRSSGGAVIHRNGKNLAAEIGTAVMPADTIQTDSRGSLGLVFSDDTRISIGPNTQIAIDDYFFMPKDSKLSFVLRVIQGTVSFLSGQIAKLAPDSVELNVPDATIGVRGTHVLIKVD